MQVSVWKIGYFEINFWGEFWIVYWIISLIVSLIFCFALFCFVSFFLSFYSLFPWTNGHWSELVKLLARVVNRGEMSPLYWMWLCVGYSQLHSVLSMKQESSTTAEKVQRPFLNMRLACWQTNLLGTTQPLSIPTHRDQKPVCSWRERKHNFIPITTVFIILPLFLPRLLLLILADPWTP